MIQTGKSPITVTTFCAIMSISLVVNLPGLAITPMLGTLHEVFPHTSQLEDQLLTVLPNLIIIPFVLLSGKLSLAKHKTRIVVAALILFCLSAIAYLFADSMVQLIVISCLIGCGAGLLIPFSTGLIADTFSGSYRLKEMGVQSGISNTAVMAATFIVGWLCHGNWHLPFSVYLIGLVPLSLSFWLKNLPRQDDASDKAINSKCGPDTKQTSTQDSHYGNDRKHAGANTPKCSNGIYTGRIVSLIAVYFLITFATISISYYCPYLVEKDGWSDSLTGTITAIYFLFILLPGYILTWFVKYLKGNCVFISAISMTLGLALFAFFPTDWTLCIGAALAGIGYGICQPILYDKASLAVAVESKSTLALALVLSSNYLAIVLAPFIIDSTRKLFNASHVTGFAFIVCFATLAVFSVIAWLKKDSFAFSVDYNNSKK